MTGNVLTALVYDARPVNELAQSQLARIPAGTIQLDAVVVTAEGIARSPAFRASVSIVGTGSNNGTGITTRARSGVGTGDPETTPPRKAGGNVGEIVADIRQAWEIDWNPESETPWGGGISCGIQVRPEDNFVWAGVDLTILGGGNGMISAAVILIARDVNGDTLTWAGDWIARAS